jgi:hypothetical protein
MKENKGILQYMHCHCLGGDLVCRYIGRQVDGKVGRCK